MATKTVPKKTSSVKSKNTAKKTGNNKTVKKTVKKDPFEVKVGKNGEKVVLTPRGKEYTQVKAFEDFKISSNWAILNTMHVEAIVKTSNSKKALEQQAKLKEAIELMGKARAIRISTFS